MKLPQLKRSRGAHRGVLSRRATASGQAGGALEDAKATFEFLFDLRKLLTDMDSPIKQLMEDDDELVADVGEAVDVFMAAERASEQHQGVATSKPKRRSGTNRWQSNHNAPQTNPSFIQL